MARTVEGMEKLGQVIKDSGMPLADLEVPFKMYVAPASHTFCFPRRELQDRIALQLRMFGGWLLASMFGYLDAE